ncbi:MAG: hypothetical protein JWP74_529 [Marmoricola sp.]|nr:hypothetical protein [Marmoricola sp.]
MTQAESGTVLVVTNERDFAADTVIASVLARGWNVERWNTETHAAVSWRPQAVHATDDYSAVWLRQFLADPLPTTSVREVDDFLVSREQWRTWLTDLAEGHARWMNPLWASRRAENKLVQLRTAGDVGLAVPPTLVTTSRVEAAEHQRRVGDCVVKALASAYFPFSDSAFMFTRDLDAALSLAADEWSDPVIVQRKVMPRVDVRVFVVGGFVTGARTVVSGTDWRTSAGEATWERLLVPDDLASACKSLLQQLGLAYGAIDFAYDGRTMWFLECNQAGEFGFVDRPLKLGVSNAIAGWLCAR